MESRKDWMLHQFKYYASTHSRNQNYQVWTHENHFIELFSPAVMQQKIDYIHDNPVRAGYVYQVADYVYSSASNYAEAVDYVIPVDCIY